MKETWLSLQDTGPSTPELIQEAAAADSDSAGSASEPTAVANRSAAVAGEPAGNTALTSLLSNLQNQVVQKLCQCATISSLQAAHLN